MDLNHVCHSAHHAAVCFSKGGARQDIRPGILKLGLHNLTVSGIPQQSIHQLRPVINSEIQKPDGTVTLGHDDSADRDLLRLIEELIHPFVILRLVQPYSQFPVIGIPPVCRKNTEGDPEEFLRVIFDGTLHGGIHRITVYNVGYNLIPL